MELRQVSLADMLDAREARAARQQELLEEFQSTLVSFTMNTPGPVKNSELILKGYLEGMKLLRMQLEYADIPVLHFEERREFTGNEAFFVVDAPALTVKRLTCEIEEADSLGRLFDMDVLGPDGVKLDRKDVGLEPRVCLICGGTASICASRRTHTVEELQTRTVRILQEHFQRQFADTLSGLAVRSLLYELAVTPKPGLVDRCNSGAHRDMDFYTFLRSATTLEPWFREMVLCGIRFARAEAAAAFQAINHIGKRAELAMGTATGGVNTHKGAIFSLGLLCGAAGRLHGRRESLTTDSLLDECAVLLRDAYYNYCAKAKMAAPKTAGDSFFQSYGITGIRGEAAAGFSVVRKIGLPLLKELLSAGHSADDAGGIVLLHLMAHAEDTCLIARAGHARWKELRECLGQELTENPRPSLEKRKIMDAEFIQNNWSSGGCADLLAMCWLLLFLNEYTRAKDF